MNKNVKVRVEDVEKYPYYEFKKEEYNTVEITLPKKVYLDMLRVFDEFSIVQEYLEREYLVQGCSRKRDAVIYSLLTKDVDTTHNESKTNE